METWFLKMHNGELIECVLDPDDNHPAYRKWILVLVDNGEHLKQTYRWINCKYIGTAEKKQDIRKDINNEN